MAFKSLLALVLIVIAATLLNSNIAAAMKCNGLKDLCDLRLDQVTMAGSHNAGSGFDGLLNYWSGGAAASCWYRNQMLSFSDQLEYGVRYFDIDTCYGDGKAWNCHCPGGGKDCGYAGSIETGLLQIDKWMKANPNEVIVIHFNRDAQAGYHKNISINVATTLLKLWNPNKSQLKMSDYYAKNNRQWPTLKEAVKSKERIFIFMDGKLARYSFQYDWVVMSNGIIASTWDTNKMTSSCSGITINAKAKCSTKATFLSLQGFGSYGLCTWDMADICANWMGEAMGACYEKRKKKGSKTVNFLLVDYAGYYPHKGYENVVNKAKFMNQKNIKKYLREDILLPELQGCSYHAGWFFNYCWKVCPEYGWCWSDVYCGKDADICKKKSLSCYSGCGYN